MAERREFLERIRVLTMEDVIKRQDRDRIYRVCLEACSRELGKLKEE